MEQFKSETYRVETVTLNTSDVEDEWVVDLHINGVTVPMTIDTGAQVYCQ